MISEPASRAFALHSAIDLCKQPTAAQWRGMMNRVIADLDQAGNTQGIDTVESILRQMWEALPYVPGMRSIGIRMPLRGDACECYLACAEDPDTACSLPDRFHVHPGESCPVHPDAPGDR